MDKSGNITGIDYKIEEIITELQSVLIEKVNDLKQQQFLEILARYNQRLYAKGEIAIFRKDDQELMLTVKGVTPEGKLITFEKTEKLYDFDEIKFLRKLK